MRQQAPILARSDHPARSRDVAPAERHGVPVGKRLAYVVQGIPAVLLYAFFKILPLAAAARLAARLFSSVGPKLALSRRARTQLATVLPELTAAEVDAVTVGVWRNVGNVAAEYIHLAAFVADPARIELVGAEHLQVLAGSGRPLLLFSAHLANWEMATIAAQRCGLDPHVFFRPFNNPIIEHYARAAQRNTGAPLIAKGARGTRRLVQVLGAGGQVIMLVDQHQTGGVEVPFFGRPAQTPAALAKLAYRFGAAIVPIRVERTATAAFTVTVEPPLALPDTGDAEADVAAVMTTVNQRLETWIRARPDQWLWFHRRWGKA